MPKIAYITKRFNSGSREMIKQANTIITEYAAQGFTLTLRQMYYQFVSRNWLTNTMKSYSRLGNIINDARLAGLIDWNAIEDRTRNVRTLAHWSDPTEIVDSCAEQFHVDMWEGQDYRPEVWIEKDSLVGVFEGVCQEFDVPLFSCRGYTSQSEMWVAAQRLLRTKRGHQTPMILHFGDHDPSGIDMTRDIRDRLELFSYGEIRLDRLALNMEQVEQFNPPPNPAKVTDSRFQGYMAEFGSESWELDALNPTTLAGLVRDNITALIDSDLWDQRQSYKDECRATLKAAAQNWDDVKTFLQNEGHL